MTVRHGHNVVVIKESRTELIELYMACCTSWIMPCTDLYMLVKFRVRFSQNPMIHFGDNEITHYEPQIIKLNACMKLYYMYMHKPNAQNEQHCVYIVWFTCK